MVVPSPTQTKRRRFSVADYHRMIDLGILGTEHKVELIYGEVVYKAGREPVDYVGPVGGVPYVFTEDEHIRLLAAGIVSEDDEIESCLGEGKKLMSVGTPHWRCVNMIARLLMQRVSPEVWVSVQGPIVLSASEPEPDITVFTARPGQELGKPTATDINLLIEVVDSSLAHDTRIKAPLYAESGVSEYWVVDLNSETVIVHREPKFVRNWTTKSSHRRGETLTIVALPGIALTVDEILP